MRSKDKLYRAVGCMSGTSRDGIDIAIIETDGRNIVNPVAFVSQQYDRSTQEWIAAACDFALQASEPSAAPSITDCERHLTKLHVDALKQLLQSVEPAHRRLDVIGFHGHTVAHRADLGWTWQIGNAQALCDIWAIPTVHDLRGDDMTEGGQGAPLLPVFHRALFAKRGESIVVLNLGGVANLTWLGSSGEITAFDSGMASALIDEWVFDRLGLAYDDAGMIAAAGTVNERILETMLQHRYFAAPYPKSLDRADFSYAPVAPLSAQDGAATLTAFSAAAVARGISLMPSRPQRLIVSGGGRKNKTMMQMIGRYSGLNPQPTEEFGWDGDAIEAQGFAYMAVRKLKGLPITFPSTTGVSEPMSGGRVAMPNISKEAVA